MAKAWYVVHTYSGYEKNIEKHIKRLTEEERFADIITDVKVPAEEVVEIKKGKRRVLNKKYLPGYILVEMDLPDREWKDACMEIRNLQGVTGFVGVQRGAKPQPISADESRAIFQKTGSAKSERQQIVRQNFTHGEQVRIIEGPFDTFTGTIEEINQEKGKLKVMVGIFGRATPVEVSFLQVEKL